MNLFSYEAEIGVLGSVLLSDNALKKVRSKLTVDHFYRPAHRQLWAAMVWLSDKKSAIDPLTLKERLIEANHLEDIGGEDYIIELAEATPSPANVEHYAQIIVNCWIRRQYQKLGEMASSEEVEVEGLVTAADKIGVGLSLTKSAPVARLGDECEHVSHGGISTGYSLIDSYSSRGGYPVAQMSMVGAYTGVGKTAWMVWSLVMAAMRGEPSLYATFADLDRAGLQERAMRNLTGWGKRPTLSFDIAELWDAKLLELRESPLDVYDASFLETGYDVETFIDWLTVMAKKKGYRLVAMDYAQHLVSRDPEARGNDLANARICSRKIAVAAKNLELAIVVGSQITEGKKGERDITKGSRSWEEDAGMVLKLKRNDDDDGKGVVIVDKNRFGTRGKENMIWDAKKVKYEVVK